MGKKKVDAQDPKMFRTIAVKYQRDFDKFAAEVEKTMNELHNANYDVGTETHPQGMLIVGRLAQQAEHPLAAIFGRIAGAPGPAHKDQFAHMSVDTAMLFNKILGAVDHDHPETFKYTVEKLCDKIFAGQKSETLLRVRKELEEDVRTHGERCDAPDCTTPKVATAIIEHIKKHVQMNLQ